MTVVKIFASDAKPALQAELVKLTFVERNVDRVHVIWMAKNRMFCTGRLSHERRMKMHLSPIFGRFSHPLEFCRLQSFRLECHLISFFSSPSGSKSTYKRIKTAYTSTTATIAKPVSNPQPPVVAVSLLFRHGVEARTASIVS